MIVPKFKAGDKIKEKNERFPSTRTIYSYVEGIGYSTTIHDWVRIEDQDNWELVPTHKFKSGDKIIKKDDPTECWYVQGVDIYNNSFYFIVANGKLANLPLKDQDEWELAPVPKFKVGDIVETGKDEEGVINEMRWVDNDIVYWVNSHKTCDWTQTLSVDILDKYNRLNSNDIEHSMDTKVETTGFMQVGKIVGVIFNDANYEDEVELQLGDYEIKVRDGKTYAVKRNPKYPDNYEECVRIAKNIHGYDIHVDVPAYGELMESFVKLLICRDAYWKIAGEQMRLDKPWKPDWNGHEFKYGLKFMGHRIEKTSEMTISHVICFPTEEMRDAFYENFKDLIEQCKELL